jgi:hypothetical protein
VLLLPRHIPETGYWVTAASDWIGGNFSDKSQTVASDQIRVNGIGPVRVRKHMLGLVNITLIQIANQGPRQRFTTHQRSYSWAERQFPFRSEKRYPPP